MRWGRSAVGVLTVALAVVAGACGGGESGQAPKPTTARFEAGASSSPGGLALKSSAFTEGGVIPERFSCKGQNTPPPLQWSGVPTGTKSLALVVTDPDAPGGVFVHWIVTGLPASTSGSLTSATLPAGAKAEPNSADQAGYTGMCPPAGQTHSYIFEVLAISTDVAFPKGASPLDKVKALRTAAGKTGKLRGEFTG